VRLAAIIPPHRGPGNDIIGRRAAIIPARRASKIDVLSALQYE